MFFSNLISLELYRIEFGLVTDRPVNNYCIQFLIYIKGLACCMNEGRILKTILPKHCHPVNNIIEIGKEAFCKDIMSCRDFHIAFHLLDVFHVGCGECSLDWYYL